MFDLAANEMILHEDVNKDAAPRDSLLQPIALSPDGSTVVYEFVVPEDPGADGNWRFKVVEVRTGETFALGETCQLSKAHFSDDGARLFIADFCADVVVFETETWTEVARLGRRQGEAVADVAVSGDVVATVGTDDVARVWNVDTEALLLEIELDTTPRNVEFLDGSHILVTTVEGEIFVFTLEPHELKSIAIDRLTRGFTAEECGIYGIDPCRTLEEIASRS